MRAAGPLLLLIVLLVPLASAHADLATANPPPGGHVDEGVTVIEFVFTEDVERDYTTGDLIDANGTSLATGPVEFDEKRHNIMRLPVTPLRSGIYSASWKALSVDTHTTRGVFVFAVGDATLREGEYATQPSDPADYDAGMVARDGFARFAFYLGLFLAMGMPLFALAVLREGPPRALFAAAASFGIVGAAGAAVGLLFLEQRTGLGMGVLDTGPGGSIVQRGAFLLAAAGACIVAAGMPRAWRPASVAAVAFGALSIYATSSGSHAAALREDTALFIAADAVHLLAAAVWIGGIVGFLHLFGMEGRPPLALLIVRFTLLALPSFALLLVTGTLASLAHMPCFDQGLAACGRAAPAEPYMRLVGLKLALMAPLAALGTYNAFVLRPKLASGASSPGRLRRTIQVEAILLAVVVGAAGVLAASPPPQKDVQEGVQPGGRIFEAQEFTEKSHVILQIEPNPVTVGLQKLVVIVHPLGPQLPNSTTVSLEIFPASAEGAETLTELEKVTPNEWEAEGTFFTTAETWKVTIILQRPDEYAEVTFDVPVVNPTGS